MNEMGGTCSMHEKTRNSFIDVVEKSEEIIPLERPRKRREVGFLNKLWEE
jgi:hypothetical protein